MRWLAIVVFSILPVVAQVREDPSYEGQPVASVELVSDPRIDLEAYRSKVQQTAGQPFSWEKVRIGGNQLFVLNSELRIPLPIKEGLGFVAFCDGGNVYRNISFRQFVDNYTNTVGVGLRYSTPIGPVRFDVGRNLNPISGISATQFFITLGQAF